jgi:hypothetical protein
LYSSDDPNCEAEHPVSGLTSRLIATQRGSSRPLPPTGEACGTHRHSPPPSPAWGMGEASARASRGVAHRARDLYGQVGEVGAEVLRVQLPGRPTAKPKRQGSISVSTRSVHQGASQCPPTSPTSLSPPSLPPVLLHPAPLQQCNNLGLGRSWRCPSRRSGAPPLRSPRKRHPRLPSFPASFPLDHSLGRARAPKEAQYRHPHAPRKESPHALRAPKKTHTWLDSLRLGSCSRLSSRWMSPPCRVIMISADDALYHVHQVECSWFRFFASSYLENS